MPKEPKERRSERMTLRMSASLKQAVEALAERDNRSVSDWICLRLAIIVKTEMARTEVSVKAKK